jgi:hypothetical protein
MKYPIPFLVLILLLSTACNRQNAEEAVQGYLTESLKDFKEQLPEEIKVLDSLLLDSATIKQKIAKSTNVDSLEKYNELLKDAKNMLHKDISTIDSVSPEIEQLFELNM